MFNRQLQKLQTTSIDIEWMQLKIQSKNILSRTNHAACIYANKLYTYGGYDIEIGILSDFYYLNLQQPLLRWKQIKCQKYHPGKRRQHTMRIYKNQILLFGGQINPIESTNKLSRFNLDLLEWSEQQNLKIPVIDSHEAIIYQNKMIILGGYFGELGKFNDDVYQYNIQNRSIKRYNISKKPIGRANSSYCLKNKTIYMFGGHNTQNLNDLWSFDVEKLIWNEIIVKSEIKPQARRGHNILEYENYIFLFGGIQSLTKQKNDIYTLNLQKKQWIKLDSDEKQQNKSSSLLKKIQSEISSKKILLQRRNTSNQDINSDKIYKFKLKFNTKRSNYQYQTQIDHYRIAKSMSQVIKESKQRDMRIKKNKMIKQINQMKKKILLEPIDRNSKSEEAMKNSLNILGNQTRRTDKNQLSQNMPLNCILHQNINTKFLIGKKPCARDGQVGLIYNQYMVVFGGDRHMMSFNDIFYLDLKKTLIKLEKLIRIRKSNQQEN